MNVFSKSIKFLKDLDEPAAGRDEGEDGNDEVFEAKAGLEAKLEGAAGRFLSWAGSAATALKEELDVPPAAAVDKQGSGGLEAKLEGAAAGFLSWAGSAAGELQEQLSLPATTNPVAASATVPQHTRLDAGESDDEEPGASPPVAAASGVGEGPPLAPEAPDFGASEEAAAEAPGAAPEVAEADLRSEHGGSTASGSQTERPVPTASPVQPAADEAGGGSDANDSCSDAAGAPKLLEHHYIGDDDDDDAEEAEAQEFREIDFAPALVEAGEEGGKQEEELASAAVEQVDEGSAACPPWSDDAAAAAAAGEARGSPRDAMNWLGEGGPSPARPAPGTASEGGMELERGPSMSASRSQELQELRAELDDVRSQLQNREQRLQELVRAREQLGELRAELDDARDQLKEREQRLQDLSDEAQRAAKQQQRAADREIATFRRRAEVAEAARDEALTNVESWKDRAKIAALRQKEDANDTERELIQMQDRWKEKLAASIAEGDEARGEVSRLQAQLKELSQATSECERLQEWLRTSADVNAQLRQELASLEQGRQELHGQCTQLTGQLEDAQTAYSEASREVAELSSRLHELEFGSRADTSCEDVLRQQLDAAKERCSELEHKLNECMRMHSYALKEAEEARAQLQAQRAEAEAAASSQRTRVEEAALRERLEEDVAALRGQIADLTTRHREELQQQAMVSREETEYLKRKNDEKDRRLEVLTCERNALRFDSVTEGQGQNPPKEATKPSPPAAKGGSRSARASGSEAPLPDLEEGSSQLEGDDNKGVMLKCTADGDLVLRRFSRLLYMSPMTRRAFYVYFLVLHFWIWVVLHRAAAVHSPHGA